MGTPMPPIEPTDEELVRRSGEGDRKAFEMLAARHERSLYRFALRACRGEREAEDALQDGLLAAWRGAATFRGESAARTWLFQVIVNACHRRHRRRAGEGRDPEPIEAAAAVPADGPGPEERIGAREISQAIDRALEGLPDDAREVLLLRDGELRADARRAVEDHLRGCDGCARFGGELRATVQAVRAHLLASPAPPPRLRDRLAEALAREPGRRRRE